MFCRRLNQSAWAEASGGCLGLFLFKQQCHQYLGSKCGMSGRMSLYILYGLGVSIAVGCQVLQRIVALDPKARADNHELSA